MFSNANACIHGFPFSWIELGYVKKSDLPVIPHNIIGNKGHIAENMGAREGKIWRMRDIDVDLHFV